VIAERKKGIEKMDCYYNFNGDHCLFLGEIESPNEIYTLLDVQDNLIKDYLEYYRKISSLRKINEDQPEKFGPIFDLFDEVGIMWDSLEELIIEPPSWKEWKKSVKISSIIIEEDDLWGTENILIAEKNIIVWWDDDEKYHETIRQEKKG